MSRITRTPSPVNAANPTILSVLQDRNPEIDDKWDGECKKNNRIANNHDSYDVVEFDDIHKTVQKWEDFNFEAVDLAYGDILHQDIRHLEPDFQPIQKLVDTYATRIKSERSVDRLGDRWQHLVLKKPLKAAATHLRQLLGGSQTKPTLENRRIEWTRPKFKIDIPVEPDWAIFENTFKICYREDKYSAASKELTYAVGETRLNQKWKSEWLARGKADVEAVLMDPSPRFGVDAPPPIMDVSEERKLPLEQIATYCRYAQTRYAFILTQTELVALRVRRIHPLAKHPTKHHAAVEYTSVPWHRKTKLTVNLAIWALGCMGMNDDHREMETPDGQHRPLDRMARLTWWEYDAKGDTYQNVISKRKIPGSEWKKEYENFVHLTEQAGNSFTSTFETGTAHQRCPTSPSSSELHGRHRLCKRDNAPGPLDTMDWPLLAPLPNPPVPLPLVPGPKLPPFTRTARATIEFVQNVVDKDEDLLEDGLVWKVRIGGKGPYYALKMFRFTPTECLMSDFGAELTQPLVSNQLYSDYFDPFSCECRAYGRLKQEGREDLALRAHGYLLLTPQQGDEVEKKTFGYLLGYDKDGFNFWGRDAEHRHLPIRAIVKELDDMYYPFYPENILQTWNGLEDLHKLGILVRNIDTFNCMGGKIMNFSRAWTTPHPFPAAMDRHTVKRALRSDPLGLHKAFIEWGMTDEGWKWDVVPDEMLQCVRGKGQNGPYGTDPSLYDWRKWETDPAAADAFMDRIYGDADDAMHLEE